VSLPPPCGEFEASSLLNFGVGVEFLLGKLAFLLRLVHLCKVQVNCSNKKAEQNPKKAIDAMLMPLLITMPFAKLIVAI
jgi:hypothetical protein